MALHATARESNVIDSIKKYLCDNLETTEKIALLFDTGLSYPKVQSGRAVDRWVSCDIGPMVLDFLSEASFELFLCTRRDNEGFRLAQLRDTVMGYLTSDGSPGDGKVSIPFYQSSSAPSATWTLLGGMVITDVIESRRIKAPDETKYKILTVRLKFGTQI
jgi:hypothetical protein